MPNRPLEHGGPSGPRSVLLVVATAGACALAIGLAAHFDEAALGALESVRATLDWGTRERLGRLADYAEILGQGWLTLLIALAIYRFDPRGRRRAVVVAFSVLAVMLATNAVKIATGRLRPKAIQKIAEVPAHVWLGPLGGLEDPKARSFPSGHTATAVAHATVLSALYPVGAPVFFALAAPVPVSRVLMRSHFVSDCVAGGLLAFLLTRWLLRSPRFGRFCERAASRLPLLARHRSVPASPAIARAG